MSPEDVSSTDRLFAVDVRHAEGRAVVALSGELDLAAAPELRERLAALSEEGDREVTLDLTHLDFIDSTGLSVLVMAFNRAHAAEGSMIIANPSLPVMRIFEITGLASVFTIAIDGEPVPSGGV
jgi:anti-sigma B factor antagonist